MCSVCSYAAARNAKKPKKFVDLDLGNEFYVIDMDGLVQRKQVHEVDEWQHNKGKTYYCISRDPVTKEFVSRGQFRSDDEFLFRTEAEAKRARATTFKNVFDD